MKRLLAPFCGLLLATAAFAHSNLQRSEPKDGAVLRESPNELRMWFSEPLKLALSTISVCDNAGRPVDRGDLHAAKANSVEVELSLSPLSPGAYKISWTAVAQDMHVTKGELSFRVAP